MTIAELRHEWEADIKRRNGILVGICETRNRRPGVPIA